jgi:SET domain-containing protein
VITDVVVLDAGPKGKGVFALRSFGEGEFIIRRRHRRVVSNRQVATLSVEDRRHLTELDFDRSAVLLPPGCYLNHSCEPNAMRSGVKVFAWRAIRKGDEITIDYRLNAFSDVRSRCLCGSPNCAGATVWSFFALDQQRQRAYLRYAPDFIRREYRRRERAGSSGLHRTSRYGLRPR